MNWISATGRNALGGEPDREPGNQRLPTAAYRAPAPRRSGPCRPSVARNTPPSRPTSSPKQHNALVVVHGARKRRGTASTRVDSAHGSASASKPCRPVWLSRASRQRGVEVIEHGVAAVRGVMRQIGCRPPARPPCGRFRISAFLVLRRPVQRVRQIGCAGARPDPPSSAG